MIIKLVQLIIFIFMSVLVSTFDEKQFGYYAFEKAGRNELPPRMNPPSYRQTDEFCPGVFMNDKYSSSKDTLCGDLKRGTVPLNPMNIVLQDQHYPFELIKNKTLHFLAKTLPYLREDHENIPKVFKIPQAGSLNGYNELYSNMDPSSSPSNYRVKRQAKATITKIDKADLNLNETSVDNQNMSTIGNKKYKGLDNNELSVQESRRGCEDGGIMCHVIQVLANSKSNNDGNLVSAIQQGYNTYKQAQSFNHLYQYLIGSLDKSDHEKTGNDQYSNRASIPQQIFNAFTSNAQQTTTATPVTNNNQDTSFNNPLGLLLNYWSNANTGSSFLSRKKKPVEMEDYMNGLNGLQAASSQISPSTVAIKTPEEQVQIAQPTPTACPSIEEYVTPVYARNYQNVWKYVVQIPHEGYFTQTIQKTSCVKNKCDYMDGQCKEASRWVSLLVAEVYYPNAKQPLTNLIPQASQIKPSIYNELNSKLNSQPQLASTFTSNVGDQNFANYDLLNNLLPANYNNDYNHYDQNSFARRASKLHQPTNQMSNQPTNQRATMSYSNSFNSQQYPQQDFNVKNQFIQDYTNIANGNQYQPNLNYNQLINSVQYQQAIKQSATNQHPIVHLPQSQAQFQQLFDLYQPQMSRQQLQYLQQLIKSKPLNNANNGGYGFIDSLTAASMNYPTIISQSPVTNSQTSTQLNQQALSNHPSIQAQQFKNNNKLLNVDSKQNEVKPRSFDAVNSHLLDSTLMRSSYINNDESMVASSSTNDKMVSNDQNTNNNNNQSTDLNNMSNSNTNDQSETSSKENNSNEECDGYDSNGCYTIRVYYDWFLVNGSCKCWKINTKGSGAVEAIKKMFIGK